MSTPIPLNVMGTILEAGFCYRSLLLHLGQAHQSNPKYQQSIEELELAMERCQCNPPSFTQCEHAVLTDALTYLGKLHWNSAKQGLIRDALTQVSVHSQPEKSHR